MADRVLCDELEERRISKVVAALEHDALADHTWMAEEVVAQTIHIAIVEEIDGVAKDRIVDSLVMRAIKLIKGHLHV